MIITISIIKQVVYRSQSSTEASPSLSLDWCASEPVCYDAAAWATHPRVIINSRSSSSSSAVARESTLDGEQSQQQNSCNRRHLIWYTICRVATPPPQKTYICCKIVSMNEIHLVVSWSCSGEGDRATWSSSALLMRIIVRLVVGEWLVVGVCSQRRNLGAKINTCISSDPLVKVPSYLYTHLSAWGSLGHSWI